MTVHTPAGGSRVPTVLVVGDINPDLILDGDVVPRFGQIEQVLSGAAQVIGGSASIAANGLARLGIATAVNGIVGDDERGRFMVDELRRSGVDVDQIAVDCDHPTGISVILNSVNDRAILTMPGTIPLLDARDVIGAVDALHPDHVHFASFFLLPGLAKGLSVLLDSLRARGITTSLDTNWDPAEEWEGLADVVPRLDYLFPNVEELRAISRRLLAPLDRDDVDAAIALASLGPTVVVKAGPDGGWSVTPRGDVATAAGLPVRVADTAGAGDSFDAGYLAAVFSGIDDERVRVRWAAVAGSLSARGIGGTHSQPTREELLGRL